MSDHKKIRELGSEAFKEASGITHWAFDRYERSIRNAPRALQILLVFLCTFVSTVLLMTNSPDLFGLLSPPEVAQERIGIPMEFLSYFAWIFYACFSLMIILILIFSSKEPEDRHS